MGNPYLIQACLRLEKIPSELEIGKEYSFQKDQHRIYQINVPMDLRSFDWKFICRIIVKEFTVGHNKTRGIFVPVKLFSYEEREIISKTYISEEKLKITQQHPQSSSISPNSLDGNQQL